MTDYEENPRDRQEGGSHYLGMGLQPWDAMRYWLSHEQFTGYLLGTSIGYLARFNVTGVSGKGGQLDVLKARHCLDKLIDHLEMMSTHQDSVDGARSRIAMFLKSGAGDPSARALLEEVAEALRRTELRD